MEIALGSTSAVWGLPIKDYLLEYCPQAHPEKKPTPFEVSEAIELIKSGYPSCGTFNLLLLLADWTNYLRTFLDDGLVPGCMRLLQQYCQTNSVGNSHEILPVKAKCQTNFRYSITHTVSYSCAPWLSSSKLAWSKLSTPTSWISMTPCLSLIGVKQAPSVHSCTNFWSHAENTPVTNRSFFKTLDGINTLRGWHVCLSWEGLRRWMWTFYWTGCQRVLCHIKLLRTQCGYAGLPHSCFSCCSTWYSWTGMYLT